MPTFRQRPLTWLFWIATACAIAVGAFKKPEAGWLAWLLTALLYVVSSWAAVSRAHRLARGAVLSVLPFAVALAVASHQRVATETPALLAYSLLIIGTTFVAARLTTLLVRRLPGQPADCDCPLWQVSIAEMLGWTLVLAIVSFAVSWSKLPPLDNLYGFWEPLSGGLPVGIVAGLFLGPRRRHDRVSFVTSIVVLGGYLAGLAPWGHLSLDDYREFVVMFACIPFWIVVVRLDEQAEQAPSPDQPSQHENR